MLGKVGTMTGLVVLVEAKGEAVGKVFFSSLTGCFSQPGKRVQESANAMAAAPIARWFLRFLLIYTHPFLFLFYHRK
jgi:hypothetical protein